MFGAVTRATGSPDTVVRLGGFSSTRPLAGPGGVGQAPLRRYCQTTTSECTLQSMAQDCAMPLSTKSGETRLGWDAAAGSIEYLRLKL